MHVMKHRISSISFMLVVCSSVLLWACGGEKDSGSNDDAETAAAHGDAEAEVNIPDGWTMAQIHEFSFAVPADWIADPESGLWYPGGENIPDGEYFTGLPEIHLHCGALPVMQGESVDERLKTMFTNTDPVSKTPVTRCSLSGYVQEVLDDRGSVRIVLTLVEDVGAGMSVINFFICSMPSAERDAYAGIFREILDTVHCK